MSVVKSSLLIAAAVGGAVTLVALMRWNLSNPRTRESIGRSDEWINTHLGKFGAHAPDDDEARERASRLLLRIVTVQLTCMAAIVVAAVVFQM